MALGDGIRRDIATVTKEERDRFRDAILALQQRVYPGNKNDPVPGGVMREIDPALSLHYWDWTQDPTHASDAQGGFVVR
jgi:hypothetical protein